MDEKAADLAYQQHVIALANARLGQQAMPGNLYAGQQAAQNLPPSQTVWPTGPVYAEMAPALIKAVIKVMSEVKKLGKEGTNTYSRYNFTSVDQFYEALGALMSANGLMDVAHEKSTEVSVREVSDDKGVLKRSAWLTAVFDFWLFHESGASYGPITRHIQVQATGAQSYAAALSFAEKYFLRNLFKVPTGDVDEVDSSRQEGLPARISTERAAERYEQELDVFLANNSDPVAIRKKWSDDRAVRREIFASTPTTLQAMLDRVTKRLVELGDRPKETMNVQP